MKQDHRYRENCHPPIEYQGANRDDAQFSLRLNFCFARQNRIDVFLADHHRRNRRSCAHYRSEIKKPDCRDPIGDRPGNECSGDRARVAARFVAAHSPRKTIMANEPDRDSGNGRRHENGGSRYDPLRQGYCGNTAAIGQQQTTRGHSQSRHHHENSLVCYPVDQCAGRRRSGSVEYPPRR